MTGAFGWGNRPHDCCLLFFFSLRTLSIVSLGFIDGACNEIRIVADSGALFWRIPHKSLCDTSLCTITVSGGVVGLLEAPVILHPSLLSLACVLLEWIHLSFRALFIFVATRTMG